METKQTTLAIGGTRTSGQDVRTANVTAVQAVANIVKSSLGPQGMDKMMVDELGDVNITNDGATILRLLDVQHPAGKVLVELAGLQDAEVGDGTTSVVILAAELLKNANEMVKNKIHPTSIISGYRIAMREACNYIERELAVDVESLGRTAIINAAKTAMSSKIIGVYADFFAEMCVDAMMRIKTKDGMFPVAAVNVLKAHGKSARESEIIDGYALNCTPGSLQMPRVVEKAKIAFIDFNLQKMRMSLQVQVLITDPEEMTKMQQRENDITKERIQKILAAGANVVLCTGGIDDLCMKYFVEAGAMAVRRCKKTDLRRIAKATGGELLVSLGDAEGNETFDPASLGEADTVRVHRVSDDECILIQGTKKSKASSIILRGPNDFMLDEMERSLHDALCVVKRTLESGRIVPGGGCVEASLSIFLEKYATTMSSREQVAIAQFAESMLVIPKTLAVNAAKDAMELVARLRAAHNDAQTGKGPKELSMSGLDLFKGDVINNLEAGIVEPVTVRLKALKFATEAAITILRIDDLIKLTPPPPPRR